MKKSDEYDAYCMGMVLIDQLHTLPDAKPADNYCKAGVGSMSWVKALSVRRTNSGFHKELQFKLTYNKEFNIQVIAVVFVYEAINAGLINGPSEAKYLTQEQWEKPVVRYNGSHEYVRKVYEYLRFTKKLLE